MEGALLLTVEILPSEVNILTDKKSNNPCLSFQIKNPVGKNQLVDHMRFYAFPVIVKILCSFASDLFMLNCHVFGCFSCENISRVSERLHRRVEKDSTGV